MFYLNGSYVPEEEAKISLLDLGLLRGLGIFDYLRTYQGHPFHLHDHLLRLRYSAEQAGLELPCTLGEISQIIARLLRENRYEEAGIKIIITAGVSSDQLLPEGKAVLAVLLYPLKPFPEPCYSQGISAITMREGRSLPHVKTLYYLPAVLALQKGRKRGAQEALYLNDREEILEATTSNFFAFKKGVLLTPPEEGILLGITRAVVLRLAQGAFSVEIRPISLGELSECEEAFVASSNKEVMPLVAVDGRTIGEGRVGRQTERLRTLFTAYTAQHQWPALSIDRYRSEKDRDGRLLYPVSGGAKASLHRH